MENADEMASPKISEERMRELIARLHPDRELYSGRQFFKKLQERHGVNGVLSFIEKASNALDKQDGLDLHFDFDEAERAVFKRTYLNFISRKEFLNTIAWGVPGAIFGAYGIAGTLEQISNPEEPKPSDSAAGKTKNFIDAYLYPPAEILIGAALVNESYEKMLEIKLEQIADAVDVLGEKIQREQARINTSGGRY